MQQVTGMVLYKQTIAADVYRLKIELPEGATDDIRPGQFLNIATGDHIHLLKRPIGICSHDERTVTICFQAKGDGTTTLADARPEACLSILLPLGNGFSIKEDEKKVALVGGGVGIFPLLSVVEGYRDQGKEFTAYLGFRGRDSVCCLNEFAEGARLVVGTDDGSCGEKANAVELFLRDYDREKPDLILSCGPPVMERVLKEELAKRNNTVPCFVSLEERMGCGIGACLVCVCNKTNGEHARVCKDGPVFPIEEVVL